MIQVPLSEENIFRKLNSYNQIVDFYAIMENYEKVEKCTEGA